MKPTYNICFRCKYPDGGQTEHRQDLKLNEIHKWIEAYFYTHPRVETISVKIWKADGEKE